MQGTVRKYYPRLGVGVIAGQDGARYRFKSAEILNPGAGLIGSEVDFLLEQRGARAIFVLSGSPWSAFGAASGR